MNHRMPQRDFLKAAPVAAYGAGDARAYVQRRLHDFFVRHLQGTEPPDRNGSSAEN